MGTSNFHSIQASKIFAITKEYANEFGDNVWSDTRSNIVYELLAIDKDKEIDWEFVEGDDYKLEDELRSFPATSIGQFYTGVHYGGMDFTITLIPKTVSGYYEGFNLDFEIRIDNDQGYGEIYNDGIEEGVDADDIEYMFEEYEYQEQYMKGIIAMHKDVLIDKLNYKIDEGVQRLEKVFTNNSEQYGVVAQFSNGETIYEREVS